MKNELIWGFSIIAIVMMIIMVIAPNAMNNAATDPPTMDDYSTDTQTYTGGDQSDYQAIPGQNDLEAEDVSTTTQEDELENQNS